MLCIFLNIFISFKWFVVCTCYVRRKMEKNKSNMRGFLCAHVMLCEKKDGKKYAYESFSRIATVSVSRLAESVHEKELGTTKSFAQNLISSSNLPCPVMYFRERSLKSMKKFGEESVYLFLLVFSLHHPLLCSSYLLTPPTTLLLLTNHRKLFFD